MLAVIPARGGSKGVPDKNIKELAGKPLIAYTIESAIKSGVFERVIVSTDSDEIAQISLEYGAEVPFIRPAEISGDMVSSDDVIMHALDVYKTRGIEFEYVCKLQPTSPLRNERHIREARRMLFEKEADFIVSVCECEHSPMWSGTIEEDLRLDDFISDNVKRACRQEMPVYYRLNGAIYMGKVKAFCRDRNFLGTNGFAYIMQQEDSVDIDSMLDFAFAELLVKLKGKVG